MWSCRTALAWHQLVHKLQVSLCFVPLIDMSGASVGGGTDGIDSHNVQAVANDDGERRWLQTAVATRLHWHSAFFPRSPPVFIPPTREPKAAWRPLSPFSVAVSESQTLLLLFDALLRDRTSRVKKEPIVVHLDYNHKLLLIPSGVMYQINKQVNKECCLSIYLSIFIIHSSIHLFFFFGVLQ